MTHIAFIGLGNMGLPMAGNLLAQGVTVYGFDLQESAGQALAAKGGVAAKSALNAVEFADVVISMLPTGRHVRELYLGDEGLISWVKPGTVLIDSSTIDVATVREVAASAASANLDFLDAPVSGGVGGAAAGTLTFMVGGTDAAVERARPMLEHMGKSIIHAGPSGCGQAAKMCNNMALGITMIGICEAFALGRKLGLTDQKLFDIASVSTASSWSLNSYCPVPGPVPTSPANRDYAGGFAAKLMLKDLRLAQQAALEVAATTPLGAEATALYALMDGAGLGGLDFSAMIKMLGADNHAV